MLNIRGNNLPRVKASNQSAIREIIYHYGPITRTEIAERLSLTLPTITTTINNLISKGLICEIDNPDETSKSIGRKASLIDIVTDAKFFLGIEMRGSLRRLCLLNYRGRVLGSVKDDTAFTDYDEDIAFTCQLAKKLIDETGLPKEKIYGIGICLPGLVDTEEGILKMHPGYKWRSKNVKSDLARLMEYSGAISVENNACARAFGAQLFHQDLVNNAPSFAYLYISTGIACPLMINGTNFYGSIAGLGETGHMVMDVNGPLCVCGNRGCLEAFSSERAIIDSCIKEIENGGADILQGMCADPSAPTIDEILAAQKAGDVNVCKIIESAIFYLGVAIANIENFIWPHTMLIEGNLLRENSNRTKLLKVIYKNLYSTTIEDVRFEFMETDDFSGAKGAAAVAIRRELETYIE